MLAAAWETPGKTIQIDFFDLKQKTRISKWSADGRFPQPAINHDERSLTERVPLAIADGQKQLVGLMVKHNRKKELVVLDFSEKLATEVRRIAHGDLILVDDLDGNGKTEAVFRNKTSFVRIEVATGKELGRLTYDWPLNARETQFDLDSKFIRAKAELANGNRLKLIDPISLKVQWDMHWPRDTDFAGLLCGGPDSEVIPKVLFRETSGHASLIASASASAKQQLKTNESLESLKLPALHGSTDHGFASFHTPAEDPRLIDPLPWNYSNPMLMFEIAGLDRSPVVLITQLFPIVLGGLVFPLLFLWSMIRWRRWNLQWFLLLPLVFVLPYVLFQLPSPLGDEYSWSSMPAWQAKLYGAIKLLPFLIFIAVFASYCLQGRWRRVALLAILGVSLPLILVASELASTTLHEGARFNWLDPRSLWLLWASVWFGGVGIAILWPLAWVRKQVSRWRQRNRLTPSPT